MECSPAGRTLRTPHPDAPRQGWCRPGLDRGAL